LLRKSLVNRFLDFEEALSFLLHMQANDCLVLANLAIDTVIASEAIEQAGVRVSYVAAAIAKELLTEPGCLLSGAIAKGSASEKLSWIENRITFDFCSGVLPRRFWRAAVG
jgi:hypothetical protein